MGLLDIFRKKAPEPEPTAHGWDAITAACERVYPDQTTPLHYGTLIKYRLGGPDPLDGVSIYRAADPQPHWHYVSYGFSDLYDEQEGPDEHGESGWGFELTFRLADPNALTAEQAPVWPVNLMQNLARYVFGSGSVFASGHHIDANGPIAADQTTPLVALGFTEDPDLGTIETPSGKVVFLQMLGLTAEDLADTKSWQSAKMYGLLQQVYPKGVTVMDRQSLRSDPKIAAAIEEGRERDGSSMGGVYIDRLGLERDGDRLIVTIGALMAGQLGATLAGRLPHGAGAYLSGQGAMLVVSPAERTSIAWGEDGVVDLGLTNDAVAQIRQTVQPVVGDYVCPDEVTWRVEKTEVKNSDGDVVETIG